MDKSVLYTITSTDPSKYNTIRTNLQVPYGTYCRLSVTNLTTKATFIVLGKTDYIKINDTCYYFTDEYNEMTPDAIGELFNDILNTVQVTCTVDNVGRLTLKGKSAFTINDMSYNTKQVTGFYNDIFPLIAEESLDDNDETIYTVRSSSVGYPMLSPILYLVSNLGAKCYDNVDEMYCDRKILMRVSNSFSSNYPIVNGNAEFSSIVPINSLSNIEFRLVDANMHDVKLLTPMYLSIQTDTIENENDEADINVQPYAQRNEVPTTLLQTNADTEQQQK